VTSLGGQTPQRKVPRVCDFDKQTCGPVVATYEGPAGQPERAAELDRRFLDFAERADQDRSGGDTELPFGYVIATARRR
jgi:hypothetical protein